MKPAEEPNDDRYMAAQRVWNDRIGIGIYHARNWRVAAFFMAILCVILSIGLVYQSSKSQIIPYIIEIKEQGEVNKIYKATESNYTPSEAEIKSRIYRVIKLLRELSTDRVVVNKNYQEAYVYLLAPAGSWLQGVFSDEMKNIKFGEQTRSIELKSINKLSEQSYRAEWVENNFQADGQPIERYKMSGIFKMKIAPPKSEIEILLNPLGIRVENMNWTKEL